MARTMKVDPTVADQAAEWWARLHDEGSSAADQQEFGAWVVRSPERIEAYLEVARLMGVLRSGSVEWPQVSADDLIRAAKTPPNDPVPLRGPPPPRAMVETPSEGSIGTDLPAESKFALRWGSGPIWAAAAAILVAFVWVWLSIPQQYGTSVGEQRSIPLGDGSRVTLNTASRIKVEFQRHRRMVWLVQGEALFSVAHDPTRPFDVITRGSVVRAIGTEFNVDSHAEETTVTVVEGRVAVIPVAESGDSHSSAAAIENFRVQTDQAVARRLANTQFPAPPGSLILVAAERVVITDAGPRAPEHVTNVAATTAWIEHRLVFDHEPLGRVAEQFNGYNHVQIVIEGADLARKEVTGVFQSDDPASFLSFLSGIPGVTVRQRSDGTYLVSDVDQGSDQSPHAAPPP